METGMSWCLLRRRRTLWDERVDWILCHVRISVVRSVRSPSCGSGDEGQDG